MSLSILRQRRSIASELSRWTHREYKNNVLCEQKNIRAWDEGKLYRLQSSWAPGQDSAALQKARLFSPGVGMIAGLFGSMLGVGGGVIMSPMILNICKTIPQRVVTGTSLAAVVSTAVASGRVYQTNNAVDAPSAVLIAASAMIMAPFGARLTSSLNCTQLRKILGYFLCAASPTALIKAWITLDGNREDQFKTDPIDMRQNIDWKFYLETLMDSLDEMGALTLLQMICIGSASGLASGLLGIGGGTIVTPMLALTTTLDHSVVLGTSLVSMIPPAMTGLLQHYRMGNVDARLAFGLLLGTSVGGALGSSIALQAPPGVLESIFAMGMMFLGRKTLMSIK